MTLYDLPCDEREEQFGLSIDASGAPMSVFSIREAATEIQI